MPGAVVKKSDTTLVIYGVFEIRPSKTQGKLNSSKFIRGAVVKKSDTTTVIYNVSAALPSKIHSKINISEFQISKTYGFYYGSYRQVLRWILSTSVKNA